MADSAPSTLAGKRILITRAESQCATLAESLRAKGAEIILLPLIRIAPPQDFALLDATLHGLPDFDWLIFTSQNAVTAVFDRLASLEVLQSDGFALPPVAAVGKATADAAKRAGFRVARTGRGSAADLTNELGTELRGKRVFLPRSDRAAVQLISQLRDLGATVSDVVVYRTILEHDIDATTKERVARVDAILFFSPSAVNAFLHLVKTGVLFPLQQGSAVGAIGAVTRAALHEAGLRCDFEAREPSVSEIVAALVAHLAEARISSASGVNS